MFVLARDYSFTWPVTVRVPIDGGKHAVQGFTARFRLLDQAAIEAAAGDARALLDRAWIGWDCIGDEAGGQVLYGPDTKRALLALPFILTALAEAYADAMAGGAIRKN
jgi:hypothetical protein